MPDVAYIALGSNVGNRELALARARAAIAAIRDTRLIAASEVEETDAIGPVPQGKYLNQMVAVSTTLPPRTLLAALHRIERAAGRVRAVKWGPRTLDVDIVLVGDSVGNVVAGFETTLPVTMDQMVYHGRAVRRGVRRALLVVDMPF